MLPGRYVSGSPSTLRRNSLCPSLRAPRVCVRKIRQKPSSDLDCLSAVSLLNASVWMKSTFKKTNSTTIPSLSIVASSLPVQTQVCSLVHARKRSQRTGKDGQNKQKPKSTKLVYFGAHSRIEESKDAVSIPTEEMWRLRTVDSPACPRSERLIEGERGDRRLRC